MTESEIEEMCEKYEVTNATALFYYCDNFHIEYKNIDKEIVDNFNDSFVGIFDSVEDYALEIAIGTGMLLGPDQVTSSFIQQYFDSKKFARDLVYGGDIWVEKDPEGIYVYYNI